MTAVEVERVFGEPDYAMNDPEKARFFFERDHDCELQAVTDAVVYDQLAWPDLLVAYDDQGTVRCVGETVFQHLGQDD
jgi:hypothetical protein